jgi:transaldolase / glucose-6-phosphate isomerase
LALRGRDKLTLVVSEPLASFRLWAEQLVAEGTGKPGRGIIPVADEPPGDPGAYGPDGVFVYVRNAGAPDVEHEGLVAAPTEHGHPTVPIDAGGLEDLGRLFFLLEFATAVGGWARALRPADDPAGAVDALAERPR